LWRRQELDLGYFQVEADDPLDKPGQRALIGQLGAKGGRACSPDDFAIVKFRAHRGARLARERDLIGSWQHQDSLLSAGWLMICG
jgi:hypothetical protein